MSRLPQPWIEWTTVEVRILREAWESGKPLRLFMHLLPRHSLRAALVKGRHMGLPPRTGITREESKNIANMRQILKAGPVDAGSLAEKSGMSKRVAQDFLKEAHADGQAHICGYRKMHRNGPPYAIFAWGDGDDVPHPKPAKLKDRLRKPSPSTASNPFRRMILDARQNSKEAA